MTYIFIFEVVPSDVGCSIGITQSRTVMDFLANEANRSKKAETHFC